MTGTSLEVPPCMRKYSYLVIGTMAVIAPLVHSTLHVTSYLSEVF